MTELPPIACTLHPSDLGTRMAELAALGRDGLAGVERGGSHVVLRFARAPGIRERVDAFVAAESACCALLAFAAGESADAIAVTMTAPAGGEAVLHGLADVIAPSA